MRNIHHLIIEAAKRERGITHINLCISFELPHDLAKRNGESEDEHDQRVNSWLFDIGAYRTIRGYTNYKEPDLPEPALSYMACELSKGVLLSLKHADFYDDPKQCYFCIFDVVSFAKQNNLAPAPWLIAKAQFAALAWPDEALRVGISPPDEDFILALCRQNLSALGANNWDNDDGWDDETYNNMAERFCMEIERKVRVYLTPGQAPSTTPILALASQETKQLKAEIELLQQQLAEMSAERALLLTGASRSQMQVGSHEFPPLIRMAIEVFQRHWHGQLDPSAEVRARANQAAIVSDLKERHPEITDAIAKAIDKVASPIDRDPKNQSGRYRLRAV